MLVILPWAYNPFILYEILKTFCGDQSRVDQRNGANEWAAVYYWTVFISAYPPRDAICLILILIVCITFSRCLVEIDRGLLGVWLELYYLFKRKVYCGT